MTEIGLTEEDREIFHGLSEVSTGAGIIDYLANHKLSAQLPGLGELHSKPTTVVALVKYRIRDAHHYGTTGHKTAIY